MISGGAGWRRTPEELEALQRELARLADEVEPWSLPTGPIVSGGCFVASSSGRELARGSERLWAAAVLIEGGRTAGWAVEEAEPPAPYVAGLLALREGPLLERALRRLPRKPDVLIVNATGRDHPRRAGLALHIGAVLGVPSVGVTDRPLLATGRTPDERAGAAEPLVLEGEPVGFLTRTRAGSRPVAVHAGWRTSPETARDAVLAVGGRTRTPAPIRRARFLARVARSRDEGRLPEGWVETSPDG